MTSQLFHDIVSKTYVYVDVSIYIYLSTQNIQRNIYYKYVLVNMSWLVKSQGWLRVLCILLPE